jgi:hypothetical protein
MKPCQALRFPRPTPFWGIGVLGAHPRPWLLQIIYITSSYRLFPPAATTLIHSLRRVHSLYTSGFLSGALSDLSVHVPAFSRVYPLHRLFLAQSDFFRTLLSGGFAEESSTRDTQATLLLHLEPNINRSAFEFCLARLYGGGPELVPPPWARSSLERPLGLLLPVPPLGPLHWSTIVGGAWAELARPSVQPATPHFLISLLITAEYLGLESIAQLAIDKIQETLTPWTVPIYLRFALGGGLVGISEQERQAGCAGVETVGALAVGRPESGADQGRGNFYGPLGGRVGEACACWLVRWGGDILALEETREVLDGERPLVSNPAVDALLQRQPWLACPELRLWRHGGLPASWIRAVISSDAFFISSQLPLPVLASSPVSTANIIMAHNAGISDGDGEWRRYGFARRVVELRRAEKAAMEAAKATSVSSSELADTAGDGSSETKCGDHRPQGVHNDEGDQTDEEDGEDDEAEYERLFSEGIYYSHLVRPLCSHFPRVLPLASTGLPLRAIYSPLLN